MLLDETRPMVTYRGLASALERAGVSGEPSEYHGTLCGLCCGSPEAGVKSWLARALDAADADEHGPADSREWLAEAAKELRAELASDEFEFAPALPDDDRPLGERVTALARWCEGFLYGLALADAGAMRSLGGDAREALDDFAQIARATSDGAGSETDENAYAELVEFVRVGVQLVFEELRQRGHR
jgi:uncharacterized protein YgfB (UPF0149 family)